MTAMTRPRIREAVRIPREAGFATVRRSGLAISSMWLLRPDKPPSTEGQAHGKKI